MLEIIHVHTELADIADQLVQVSLSTARLLMPILLLITLGFSLVRSLLSGDQVRLDFKLLIRGLIIMLLVGTYTEWTYMLALGVSALTELFNMQDEQIAQVLHNLLPDQGFNWISNPIDGIRSLGWFIATMLQEGLTITLRFAISLIRSFILVFLFIIGPLSLSLSVIPSFQEGARSWLQGFLGVALWSVTLELLDNIVVLYYQHGFQLLAQNGEFSVSYGIAVNIVIALAYLLTPLLTSYILQAGAISNFLGAILTAGAASMITGKGTIGMIKRTGGSVLHTQKRRQATQRERVDRTRNTRSRTTS